MIKYTRESLCEAVRASTSYSNVCRILGIKAATGSQSHIKKRISFFNIDTSHFLGKGWSSGAVLAKKDINKYLNNEIKINSHYLRTRLIKEGLKKAECEICENDTWMGNPIPLELHHIDCDHYNNNLSNIKIICPNCHAIETNKNRTGSKMVCKTIRAKRMFLPRPEQRKIKNRPSVDELLKEVKEIGYVKTGKKFGVSDNCIRKWIKWGSAEMVDKSALEADAK